MNNLQKELKEVAESYDTLTTSDLQGVVEVIAKKYDTKEDLCLNYIYGLVVK